MPEEHVRRELLIRLPSGDTQAQTIEPDVPLSIGRGDANSVVIRKPGVAEQHCSVMVVEDRVVLVSVSPSAPTLVNGDPVERAYLSNGDQIAVGPIEMTYREAAVAPAPVSDEPAAEHPDQPAPISVPSTPATPVRDATPAPVVRQKSGPPPRKSVPAPRQHRKRLLWIAGCVVLVTIAAGGVYLLWSAQRYKIDRHRARVAKAIEEGRFARARDEAQKFVEAFPDAPDVAQMEETALYATIRDRLGARVMERLSETQELLRQYLDRFPDGHWRATLLARAYSDYVGQATTLIERGELTGANLARAENLLGLARSLSSSLPADVFDPQTIKATQARIADRRDEIQFQEALTQLSNAQELALSEQKFDHFFEQLRQIRTLWPARELPDDLVQAVAAIHAAEHNAASLATIETAADVVPPPDYGAFRRGAVSVRYETGGEGSGDGRRVCVVQGGTLYALDAGSGQLVWSQPVLHHAIWPPAVSDEHGTVVTLQGTTGLAAWRCLDGTHRWSISFGANLLGPPAVLEDHLYILTVNGDLLRLSLDGDLVGCCRLGEPFDQPGSYDASSQTWVGISTGGTLYRLDLRSGECLGIAREACRAHRVLAAPIVVGPFVCVPEASPSRETLLRVLRFEANAVVEQSRHRLRGWVQHAAEVGGGLIALATDAGMTYLFGCNSTDLSEGVFPVGELELPGGEQAAIITALDVSFKTARFLHVTDHIATVTFDFMTGQAKVAGPPDEPSAETGGTCTSTILTRDDLFVAAACPDGEGLTITGFTRQHPRQARWKTTVGTRAYPFPLAEPAELAFISERGEVLQVSAESLSSADADASTVVLESPVRGFDPAAVVKWDASAKRALLCTTDGDLHRSTLTTFEYNRRWRRVSSLPLPEPVAMPPLPCGDAVLVVLRSGRLALVEPHDDSPQPHWAAGLPPFAASFPRTVSGPIELAPDVFALADGAAFYYLRTALDRPALERATLADQLELRGNVLSLATAGEHAYVADESGQVIVCAKAELKPVARFTLEPGTRMVALSGAAAVVGYSPTGMLARFDGPARSWTWIPAASCSVSGKPVTGEGVVVITCKRGDVYVLDQESGDLRESYSAPLRWSAPLRPTPTHLIGVTTNGEVWSCERGLSPDVDGSEDAILE